MSNDYENSTAHDTMNEVAGIQKYAMQVARAADALSRGDALTQRLIDAVHSGSSTAVEEIFAEAGVDTRVTLATVDGPETGKVSDTAQPAPVQQTAAAARAQAARTRTVTVTIGIGPISISVTVTKKSK
ncbi:hypothetical protein [Cryobacterium tagatosivorans]|uniref:Uncharacterized protein n=1 Tax=Cryobacterium tagatosivorans TaxID=1259199 RepID=A0A4R8UCY6_9MICO|nr:hypothetical protein [Cryobacterium tagatosivorans]TFB48725.1 hypothetical protein E3O23_12980 [Cryobacterium tagatosivorans]